MINAVIFKDFWLYFDKKHPELLNFSRGLIERATVNLQSKLLTIKNREKMLNIVESLINQKLIRRLKIIR